METTFLYVHFPVFLTPLFSSAHFRSIHSIQFRPLPLSDKRNHPVILAQFIASPAERAEPLFGGIEAGAAVPTAHLFDRKTVVLGAADIPA